MKYIVSIWLMIAGCCVYADEILPVGCKPLQVKAEAIKLPEHKPSVVMIHNLSNMDLWLTHANVSSGTNLNTKLQAGLWSALAVDKDAFELNCVESKPGHEQQVDCASVVAVCQWLNATKPESVVGTVWVGENMKLRALMAFVGRNGFELTPG